MKNKDFIITKEESKINPVGLACIVAISVLVMRGTDLIFDYKIKPFIISKLKTK